jgi:hypothetical protein
MKSKLPRHCQVSPSWCFGLPALSRLSLRTSAPQLFRYAGWRPRAPEEQEDGARKMKNPPADCSGRVWVGVENVRSVATQWVGVVLPSGL